MSKELNFKQELTACFGKPVAENPTQAMVEAAYRHHNLAWRYLTVEVDPADLANAVLGARAMGFRGDRFLQRDCTNPRSTSLCCVRSGRQSCVTGGARGLSPVVTHPLSSI